MTNGIHQRAVLFAYDGSDFAKAAISDAAQQLESDRHAIVLTVARDLAVLPQGPIGVAAPPPELEALAEREARKIADEGAELARSEGFDAMSWVEKGEPVWRTIVDVADKVNASLVVLGSHGRSGVRRLVLGSVASAVASHTDRDVLIVHLPPDEDADARVVTTELSK